MTHGNLNKKLLLIISCLVLTAFSTAFVAAPLVVLADNAATSTSSTSSSSTPSEALQDATIAFQGTLNNASGTPVPDGLYNLDFKIYDAPTDGNVQWEESFTGDQRISVASGTFSVSLGEAAPINLNFDGASYYLAVTVGGDGDSPVWDTEMTPRREIITIEELLAQANADGKSVLAEFISLLNSGNNMVVIVDSATMASLLSSLEQQTANPTSTLAASSGGGNGGGILGLLAGFFINAFENIQSQLADIGSGMTQSLSLLADISAKVDQIYQAVVVNGDAGSTTVASTPPGTDVASQQSGSAILPAGEASVSIITPAIEDDSNVFITLLDGSNQETIPQADWAITNRVDGQYFTITFDEPASSDRMIDWWVLNTDTSDGLTANSVNLASNTTIDATMTTTTATTTLTPGILASSTDAPEDDSSVVATSTDVASTSTDSDQDSDQDMLSQLSSTDADVSSATVSPTDSSPTDDSSTDSDATSSGL
jgi:hypothetical protein